LRDAVPALAAALAFSLSTPAVKAWGGGIPDLFVSGWLYVCSGVGLAIVLAARRGKPRPRGRAAPGDWRWLAGGVASGGVLAPYAYVRGVAENPAHVTSMLLALEAVATAVLARALFRERLEGRRALGIVLIVVAASGYAGLSGATEGGGPVTLSGVAWTVAACVAWALDNVLTRRVVGLDATTVACVKGLAGGAVSLALGAALSRAPDVPWTTLAAGAAVGFVSYGLSLVLFVRSLRVVGAARTAALFATAPFLGAVLSALALRERLSSWAPLAAAVLAGGVVLVGASRGRTLGVPSDPPEPPR
jgi:drug/metabolite transporter (DMT)-like permease